MKPKLICVDDVFLNAGTYHLPLFSQYVDIEQFDPTTEYKTNDILLYKTNEAFEKIKQYVGKCKIIKDALWECYITDPGYNIETYYDIALANITNEMDKTSIIVPKWFWYEEHFSQQDKKPSQEHLPYTFNKTKTFLLQIGDAHDERIKLYKSLHDKHLLDNARYSFLDDRVKIEGYEVGIGLEGTVKNYDPSNPPFPQRNYDPDWYNSTHFTLICESFSPYVGELTFITEKTFKPIMYGHPFLVFGDPGTITCLKNYGFDTFDNIFDHSYDEVRSVDQRLKMIIKILQQTSSLEKEKYMDAVLHNHRRFWDTELVKQQMNTEIIDPLLDFIYN